VKFIAISTDSVNHSRELAEEHEYAFSLISDRGAKITKRFNVYIFARPLDIIYLKTKLAVPSTFLINKNLEIAWTYIGDREDRPSVELLLKKFDEKL
jgi:peroxiredoxin